MAPEGHITIAQIGVSPAEGEANCLSKHSVTQMADRRQICAATPLDKTGSFRHVGSRLERRHECADVPRIHGSVSIHHDQDVASSGVKAAP
jgi:hypothetical protein